jgi:hypothetical protein
VTIAIFDWRVRVVDILISIGGQKVVSSLFRDCTNRDAQNVAQSTY